MADSKGFVYAYGWNVFYEILLGLWSRKGEGSIARQRAWAWALLIFLSIWLPQAASLSILSGDLNAIIECLSMNMSYFAAMAKLVVLQCQRNVIGSVLDTIAEDWEGVKDEAELRVMLKTARLSRLISIISVSLTTIGSVDYVISQPWIVANNVKHSNLDPRLANGFIYVTYFPFDTTNPFVFVPIWTGQVLGSFIGAASYTGPDCLVSMAVLHLCGQLNIICNSLRNLIDGNTAQQSELYWRKLGSIVKRHEELNQMSLVIREIFSSILLLQILVCSLSFCFQGYAIFTTMIDRNESQLPILKLIFSALYGATTVTHIFIYCYVGDRLLVESTRMGDDLYSTAWYDLAPKEARAILFVCHRSRIPLEVKAGKFCTFNLQLFNSILKNSMGYLSMLMALKERLVN